MVLYVLLVIPVFSSFLREKRLLPPERLGRPALDSFPSVLWCMDYPHSARSLRHPHRAPGWLHRPGVQALALGSSLILQLPKHAESPAPRSRDTRCTSCPPSSGFPSERSVLETASAMFKFAAVFVTGQKPSFGYATRRRLTAQLAQLAHTSNDEKRKSKKNWRGGTLECRYILRI